MQLETERLKLVSLSVDYAEDLLELWHDKEVIRYTNACLLSSVEEVKDKITKWLRREWGHKYEEHFVILQENTVIGIIGMPNVKAQEYGFYYQLIKRFWGKGYGKEAAKAVFDYAFQEVHAEVLLADAVTTNGASMKILEGLNFKKIKLEKNGFTQEGKVYDVMHFEYRKVD